MLTILAIYLLFVTRLGPALMKNRAPMRLRGPMLAYNVVMVTVNVYFFGLCLTSIDGGRRFLQFDYTTYGGASGPQVAREVTYGYWCYLSRWADLLDTVFFVLRKKDSHVTFLHLYHHTMVPVLGWLAMKMAPMAAVLALFLTFNTGIHAAMYGYYALALFPRLRPYLWWKRWITVAQLIQFATCFLYSVVMVFLDNGIPPFLFWFAFAQNPFFFYMFYKFYRRTYGRVENGKKAEKAGRTESDKNGQNGKKVD